ncbi:MAG: DUF6616 family protein [Tunicatimonas sp.]
MRYFIELWKAKDAWNQLSKEERTNYVSQVGQHMGKLVADGMEVVTWAANDPATTYRAGYDFFSVMKFPNQEMVQSFEALVEGAGWYQYFEQVNLSGAGSTPEAVMQQMIER